MLPYGAPEEDPMHESDSLEGLEARMHHRRRSSVSVSSFQQPAENKSHERHLDQAVKQALRRVHSVKERLEVLQSSVEKSAAKTGLMRGNSIDKDFLKTSKNKETIQQNILERVNRFGGTDGMHSTVGVAVESNKSSRAYAGILYDVCGILLRERVGQNLNPVIISIRKGSVADSLGVRTRDELFSIDPAEDVVGSFAKGLRMEAVIALICTDEEVMDVRKKTWQASVSEHRYRRMFDVLARARLEYKHRDRVFVREDTSKMYLRINTAAREDPIQVAVNANALRRKVQLLQHAVGETGVSESKLLAHAWRMFDTLDVNQSGSIDPDEMQRGLDLLGCTINKKNVTEMFREADIDNSGHIEWYEFKDVMYVLNSSAANTQYPAWEQARSVLRIKTLQDVLDPHACVQVWRPRIFFALLLNLAITIVVIIVSLMSFGDKPPGVDEKVDFELSLIRACALAVVQGVSGIVCLVGLHRTSPLLIGMFGGMAISQATWAVWVCVADVEQAKSKQERIAMLILAAAAALSGIVVSFGPWLLCARTVFYSWVLAQVKEELVHKVGIALRSRLKRMIQDTEFIERNPPAQHRRTVLPRPPSLRQAASVRSGHSNSQAHGLAQASSIRSNCSGRDFEHDGYEDYELLEAARHSSDVGWRSQQPRSGNPLGGHENETNAMQFSSREDEVMFNSSVLYQDSHNKYLRDHPAAAAVTPKTPTAPEHLQVDLEESFNSYMASSSRRKDLAAAKADGSTPLQQQAFAFLTRYMNQDNRPTRTLPSGRGEQGDLSYVSNEDKTSNGMYEEVAL